MIMANKHMIYIHIGIYIRIIYLLKSYRIPLIVREIEMTMRYTHQNG